MGQAQNPGSRCPGRAGPPERNRPKQQQGWTRLLTQGRPTRLEFDSSPHS